MSPHEAKAYIDGFCDGAIFFAASLETHAKRLEVFKKIKAQLRQAQEIAKRES